MFFMAETNATSYPCSTEQWSKLSAKTLNSAKVLARKNQRYHGTTLYIAQGESEDNLRLLSYSTADALNMSYKYLWTNLV